MKSLNVVTLVIAILGALNWGLMGLFQIDLVATLFGGPQTTLSRVAYIAAGLAGLYQLAMLLERSSSEAEEHGTLPGRPSSVGQSGRDPRP